MRKLLLILALLLLSGCAKGMTNDEIIAEKDKCLKGGMSYEILDNAVGQKIVVCAKPEEVKWISLSR